MKPSATTEELTYTVPEPVIPDPRLASCKGMRSESIDDRDSLLTSNVRPTDHKIRRRIE